MLDSNTFDYIYNSGLTNRVQNAVDNGKLQLFATDVQEQEIEKISNDTRKQVIRQTAEKIRVAFIETWGMVVGPDQPSNRGFGGSRVDHFRIPSDQDVQLFKILEQVNMQHPLKNSGDILILYTAIKENMDYLVTEDKRFKKSLELFKIKRNTKVQIIDNEGFKKLLRL
jgi:rRNA-processing protein FCF1